MPLKKNIQALAIFAISLALLGCSDKEADIPVPSQQKEFTDLLQSFSKQYAEADNQIKKTDARFARKNALIQWLRAAFGAKIVPFSGWVGKVCKLTTEQDGKASLKIKLLGSDTSLQTWNNSFSDIETKTMISRDDPIYPSLREIKDGDIVNISGSFFAKHDFPDLFLESSITEEGAMLEPEFIVKFRQVYPISSSALP